MSEKNYGMAVFDVDGTLLDTTEGMLAAVRYAVQAAELPLLSEEAFLTFIGPPIQNSLKAHYELSDEEVQRIAELFRDRYKTKDLFKAVPYRGIYELLDRLKKADIEIAIATYKREDYALELLKYFHFDRYTDIMHGADNFNKLKKKDIIIKCMKEAGISDYQHAVMIGDSENDAIGAEALGMNFLGVTYGFGFHSAEDVKVFPNIGIAEKPVEISDFLIGSKSIIFPSR